MDSHKTTGIEKNYTIHELEKIRPYTIRLEKILEETIQQDVNQPIGAEKINEISWAYLNRAKVYSEELRSSEAIIDCIMAIAINPAPYSENISSQQESVARGIYSRLAENLTRLHVSNKEEAKGFLLSVIKRLPLKEQSRVLTFFTNTMPIDSNFDGSWAWEYRYPINNMLASFFHQYMDTFRSLRKMHQEISKKFEKEKKSKEEIKQEQITPLQIKHLLESSNNGTLYAPRKSTTIQERVQGQIKTLQDQVAPYEADIKEAIKALQDVAVSQNKLEQKYQQAKNLENERQTQSLILRDLLSSPSFSTENAIYLLKKGAHPDTQNKYRETLIHILANKDNNANGRNNETIKELVSVWGADINITNFNGHTPLSCYIQDDSFDVEVAAKLVCFGAHLLTSNQDLNQRLRILQKDNKDGKNDAAIEKLAKEMLKITKADHLQRKIDLMKAKEERQKRIEIEQKQIEEAQKAAAEKKQQEITNQIESAIKNALTKTNSPTSKKQASKETNASENYAKKMLSLEEQNIKREIEVRKRLAEESLKKKTQNPQLPENKKTETPKQPLVKNTSLSQTMYEKEVEANYQRFIATTNSLKSEADRRQTIKPQNLINKTTETDEKNPPPKTSFSNPFTFISSKPPVTTQEKANNQGIIENKLIIVSEINNNLQMNDTQTTTVTKSNQTDQRGLPDFYTLSPSESDLNYQISQGLKLDLLENFNEVQKNYDQAVKSLHEINENINIAKEEKANQVLQCINDYKNMESKVKGGRDSIPQCKYYSGLIELYTMYIKLDLDIDNRINAYADRGMAHRMLASYNVSYINNVDRANNREIAAKDFSLAIELLQKNQKSGLADQDLQKKIAELCIQRAFVNSSLNAMGMPIVKDCIKYLANHPWGPYASGAQWILIENLEKLYKYEDFQHRYRHDENKSAFLNALQDPTLSIDEQEQILKWLIDSSPKDIKGKEKGWFSHGSRVGTFLLKHEDTLNQIINMLKNLQKRKSMAEQAVYTGSSNPGLLYPPKPNSSQSNRNQNTKNNKFNFDDEFDKNFEL